jgi:hypothetical protein
MPPATTIFRRGVVQGGGGWIVWPKKGRSAEQLGRWNRAVGIANSRRGKSRLAAEAALLGLLGERDDKDTVREATT